MARLHGDSIERIAQTIVSVLRAVTLRVECDVDTQSICYAVRSNSLKLRSIVLERSALQRLLTASDGVVKVEYLKRDLLRVAASGVEFRYPR